MAQHSLNIQYTYIDALNLADASNQKKKDFINNILKKYGDSSELITNPFLTEYVKEVYRIDSSEKYSGSYEDNIESPYNPFSFQADTTMGTTPLTGNAPNNAQYISWEAALINGMANFIAKRMKDEITAMAIDKVFRTNLDSLCHVRDILPKTYRLIKTLSGEDKIYSSIDLECIRQAAIIDIRQLPQNIISNVNSLFIDSVITNQDKYFLRTGLMIFSDVLSGTPPDIIIEHLCQSSQITGNEDGTTKNIFDLLHLMSCALKAPSRKEQVWVSPSDLSIKDIENTKKPEVRLFYGLLIQQISRSEYFRTLLGFHDSLIMKEDQQRIHQLVQTAFQLNYAIDGLRMNERRHQNIDNIIYYTDRMNQIVQSFTKTVYDINTKCSNDTSHMNKIKNSLPKLTSYLSITTAVLKRDYKTVFPLLIAEFSDILDIPQDDKNLIFLAGQISSVRSSEEFEAVLESYALPIGASRLKRHSKINLSINCYGGVTIGCEYYNDAPDLREEKNIGLAAPIGVAFTFFDGSTSLFLSLLDLGTVVNQRLNGNSVSFPQLKLEHFFAPGLGLYFNITDMPISFGFHFNYIPNLRTIEFENSNAIITETKKSVIRLNFSVLVDIPLFTLYNR